MTTAQATSAPQARTVNGAGGYVYRQHPDGTIQIIGGPEGVGQTYAPGSSINKAITQEIGTFPVTLGPNATQPPAEEGEPGFLGIPWSLAHGEIDGIQARVDALTEQGQRGEDFTEEDKEFVHDLYWWIGAGGYGKGLYEASKLQRHYINGGGRSLEIDAEVYETSTVVQHAMAAIREHIRADISAHGTVRNGGHLRSTDVLGPQRFESVDEQGQILQGGILLAEQANHRLKYANNRFALASFTEVKEGRWPWQSDRYVETTWRVDDVWDFASFDEQRQKGRHDVTHLPLGDGVVLKLPDGLSAYLVDQGVADEYEYFATWRETWTLESKVPESPEAN